MKSHLTKTSLSLTSKIGLAAVAILMPLALHAKGDADREKFHAAMENCISSNQDKLSGEEPARPGPNENLTDAQKADRAIIGACMKTAGFDLSKHGPGGHHGPRAAESSSSDSASSGVN